jgi:predicted transcriptional regulator of viral defense system
MSITRKLLLKLLRERGMNFFTISDICSLCDINNNYASQIVYQLKMDEEVEEIEKGKYIMGDYKEFPLLIAYKTVQPSYISFKTALFLYKMRKDTDDEIYIATPKRKRPLDYRKYNFKYITIKPYKFFGFVGTIIKGNNILVAEPEKAIIDSLEELKYGPEINKFKNILSNSIDLISIDKLIKYARRFHDKSLIARLGYILESIGIEIKIPEKYLPKDYIKLDPCGERRGKWVSKWNIIDNL